MTEFYVEEGSFVWPDDVTEAAADALAALWDDARHGQSPEVWQTYTDDTEAVLAAVTPHVEGLVRQAREEGRQEGFGDVTEGHAQLAVNHAFSTVAGRRTVQAMGVAIDLLANARCTYLDPNLRMAWGRRRKSLPDALAAVPPEWKERDV